MSHSIQLIKEKDGLTVLEYGVMSFIISLATIATIVSLEYHLLTLMPAQ